MSGLFSVAILPLPALCVAADCPAGSVWNKHYCPECKCEDGSNPPIGHGFPIGEIGNSILNTLKKQKKPGFPGNCEVTFVMGNTGVGKPNVGRACPGQPGSNGKVNNVTIVIEPGTTICMLKQLLLHELQHARQFCRKGVEPGTEFPPKGMNCKTAETEAYREQCELAADQECLVYEDTKDWKAFIAKCIEYGINGTPDGKWPGSCNKTLSGRIKSCRELGH